MKKIICILAILLFPVWAWAIDVSSCGQNLSSAGSTYTLTQNISASSGTCLNVTASNITIDGNGKTMTITTNNSDTTGIDGNGNSGLEIKNLTMSLQGTDRFYGLYEIGGADVHNCTFTVTNHSMSSCGSGSYPYVVYNAGSAEIYGSTFNIDGGKVNVFGTWGRDNTLIHDNTITYDCNCGGRVFLMNGGANGWQIYNNDITVTGSSNSNDQYVVRIRGLDSTTASNHIIHHNTIDATTYTGTGTVHIISLGDNSNTQTNNDFYYNWIKAGDQQAVQYYSSNFSDHDFYCNKIEHDDSNIAVQIGAQNPSDVVWSNNSITTNRVDGYLVNTTTTSTGTTFCESDVSSGEVGGGGSVSYDTDPCQDGSSGCYGSAGAPNGNTTFYCDCSSSGNTGTTCSGGASSCGTYSDPFISIADIEAYESVTGFADGATRIAFLEGSTCTMTSDLDVKWEGTDSDNYAVLCCYDGEGDFDCDGTRPILTRDTGASGGIVQFSQAISYFRIQDLQFKNSGASWATQLGYCISTLSDAAGGNNDEGYLIFDNNYFYRCSNYSIQLAQVGTNSIITNNTFEECGQGVYFVDEYGEDGASYGYVANNTCNDLRGRYDAAGNLDGHCISLQTTDYFIVEDNSSTDAYNNAYILWIEQYNESNHNVFRNNTSSGNRQSGFLIYHADGDPGGHGNLIYGNIDKESADETSDRPSIRIVNLNDSQGNYVFNNTSYNAHYGGLGMGSTSEATLDYLTFLNNIVVTDALTADQNELVWVEEGGTNNANFTIDYNLWWSLGGDPSSNTLWETPDDDTDMTWANWKADGWGGNGIVDNPDFVDTTDFELQSYSPCIDAGTWLTHVTSATGSGTTIDVNNTYILHDDMGLLDEDGNAVEGMLVSFFDNTNGRQDREITGITYGTSIVVDSSVSWIYNGVYPNDPDYTTQIALRFSGNAPDIGAVEYESPLATEEADISGLVLE